MEELEQALARLPEDPPTLARAAVLTSLANTLMRMGAERGPAVGRTALDAARAVGATSQEASALITLGSSLSYLVDSEEGEALLREGLRLALDDRRPRDRPPRLRQSLRRPGGGRSAPRTPPTPPGQGVELAQRVGLPRNFGAYLIGNLVEPLVRLGEWSEAVELAEGVAGTGLTGVFPASVEELLGYMAAKAGRLDDADAARAQRPPPARREPASRSSPRPCSTSRPTSPGPAASWPRRPTLVAGGLADEHRLVGPVRVAVAVAEHADQRRRGRPARGTGTAGGRRGGTPPGSRSRPSARAPRPAAPTAP